MGEIPPWPSAASLNKIEVSTAILKGLISDTEGGAYIALPAVQNYPFIEGVCNHFELTSEDPEKGLVRKPLQMLIQMKLGTDAGDLENWLVCMHQHAKAVLGLRSREYYSVLYCSQHHHDLVKLVDGIQGRGKRGSSLLRGTIVVGEEALSHLLEPFGMTPLLQLLKEKA